MFPPRSTLCSSSKSQMTTSMTLRSHKRIALKVSSPYRSSSHFTPDKAYLLLENLKASFQFNMRSQEAVINANKALNFVCKFEHASSEGPVNATAFTCNKLFATFNQSMGAYSDLSPHLSQCIVRGVGKLQKKIAEEKTSLETCLSLVMGKKDLDTRQLAHFYRASFRSGLAVQFVLMQLQGSDLENFKQSIREANQSNEAIKQLASALQFNEVYRSTIKLINAVKNQEIGKIHEILETEKVSFEIKDPYGMSAITYARISSCKETAKAIFSSTSLSHDLLIQKNPIGWSLLLEIAAVGSESSILALLESGRLSTEDFNMVDANDKSFASHLASKRSYKIIGALLNNEYVTSQVLENKDAGGDNLVSNMVKNPIASKKQFTSAVKAILSSDKVTLEMLTDGNKLGFSALQRMVDYGFEGVNQVILDSDKVTIEALSQYNQYGGSPLCRMTLKGSPVTHEAILNCDKVDTKSLIKRFTNLQSPLMIMIIASHVKMHQAILSSEKITREALISRGDDRAPHLYYLSEYGSTQTHLDILASDKVQREDLIYSNEESLSVLDKIVERDNFLGHLAVLDSEKVLVEDLTKSNEDEMSPLSTMIKHGSDVTHEAILASEKIPASVLTEKDSSGVFPLLQIASSYYLETQQAILRSDKVTPESLILKDSRGNFPLIYMAYTQDESLHAEILSSEKVSKEALQIENSEGQTPLLMLASTGGPETYLSILGANKVDHDMLLDRTQHRLAILEFMTKSKHHGVHRAILDSDKVSTESLNIECSNKWTPLKFMCFGAPLSTTQALLASEKVTPELLSDRGSLGLSAIHIMSAKKSIRTCHALLDSEKVTKESLIQKGLLGDTALIHMSLLRNSELHQALLDSDKVDNASLCSVRNDKGFTALMGFVRRSPQESLQAVLKSDKVSSENLIEKFEEDDISIGCQIAVAASKETIELLIGLHSSIVPNLLENLRDDMTTRFKIEYIQSPPSLDKIKRVLSQSSREEQTDLFKVLISLSQRARFLAAMEHEDLLCSTLSFSPLITLSSGSFDTLPTPDSIDSIDIGDLKSTAIQIFPEEPEDAFTPLDEMIARVKSREPYFGLPSQETSPAKFEKAYAHIEKGLKVFVVIVGELSSKYRSATGEEAKKDLKERIKSFYSRLSSIAQRCGTRYTQDIPMLYQELALEDDIDCIQAWKSQSIAIPASSDPRHAIKEHLTPTLSKLKMQALKEVYTKLTPSSNSHSISAFWKAIADVFKLDEDIDPTTEALRVSIDTVKKDFLEMVDKMELVEEIKPLITPSGDSNPYSALVGSLAHQCEYDSVEARMKAFNIDDTTYEPGHMTKGFIALCLIEAELASI